MTTITLRTDDEAIQKLGELLKEHPEIKIEKVSYSKDTDFMRLDEVDTQYESTETIQISMIEYHQLMQEIKLLREILSTRDQVQRGEVIDHDTLFNDLRLSYSGK